MLKGRSGVSGEIKPFCAQNLVEGTVCAYRAICRTPFPLPPLIAYAEGSVEISVRFLQICATALLVSMARVPREIIFALVDGMNRIKWRRPSQACLRMSLCFKLESAQLRYTALHGTSYFQCIQRRNARAPLG